MRSDAIQLGERFTDLELFRMFNVDVAPSIPHDQGDRRPLIEEGMCFNDIKIQLWSEVKRPLSRGERKALQSEDYCVVSDSPPGSEGRIADLRAHFSSQREFIGPQGEEIYKMGAASPFDCPDEQDEIDYYLD